MARMNTPACVLLTRLSIFPNIQIRIIDIIAVHKINKAFRPNLTSKACRSLAAASAKINAIVVPASKIRMTDFIVQILGKKARLCCLLVDIVTCVGSLLVAVINAVYLHEPNILF